MMIFLLAQAMAGMQMPPIPAPAPDPSGRIDVSGMQDDTLVEMPARAQHHNHIDTAMLAPPTIAFCERTHQTRCENNVSSLSGGAKVVVCKVRNRWLVNKCPVPRRRR